MKKLNLLFLFILITFFLPIGLDIFIVDTTVYPFIWSLIILPAMGFIILFPTWPMIFVTMLLFGSIKYIVDILELGLVNIDVISLFSGTIIDWSILITVGYFKVQHLKALKQVEELTIVDPLTKVYNRRYFDLYLEKAIPFSKNTGTSLHLLLLDIDFFKRINDQYGHTFGDEVLKGLAKKINENLTETDSLIRFGGEEFAIIFQKYTSEECQITAECIRKKIEDTPFNYQGQNVFLTVSIGIAKFEGESAIEIIDKADKALYQSKTNGRNQITLSHHV